MTRPIHPFHAAALEAVASALGMPADRFEVQPPPPSGAADFCVGCFSAARQLHQPPERLARRVAEGFRSDEWLAEATAAGPLVSFRVQTPRLFAAAFAATEGGAWAIPASRGAERSVCIDSSSPDLARPVGYAMIRSSLIGSALVRMHRALGDRVVAISQPRDWGEPQGALLAARERWEEPAPLTRASLSALYARFRRERKTDSSLEARARRWLQRLESGETRACEPWRRFRDVAMGALDPLYARLGIQFDEVRCLSEYAHAGHELSEETGAPSDATLDLATAIDRFERHAFRKALYVVDRERSLHLEQVFAVLEKAGHEWASRCRALPVGRVRIGGRKSRTHSADATLLDVLLEEAGSRVADRLRRPGTDGAELQRLSHNAAVGAVVFANLLPQRERDVDLDIDEVTALEGDSGPAVQRAHARCCSLLRRASGDPSAPETPAPVDSAPLTGGAERRLALQILDLPDAVARAVDHDDAHLVCHFLLDLCTAFAHFCATADASSPTRAARLALVDSTRATLKTALGLLGIEAPEHM